MRSSETWLPETVTDMKSKRSILCLLTVVLCIVFLYGCGNAKELAAEPYAIHFEKTSEFAPGEESTGGVIVVRERKYTYNETDLMILQVENTTDRAYSVTINGIFYDENGKELGTDSKTFEEFASKHQRYFLFRPGFAFERFEYKIETSKHSSDCPAALLTAEFVGLRQGYAPGADATIKTLPTLLGGVSIKNNSNVCLDMGIQYLIIFDENGEIFSISQSGTAQNIEPSGKDDDNPRYSFHTYQQTDKIKDWPEAIRDHVRGIVVVDGVTRSKFS